MSDPEPAAESEQPTMPEESPAPVADTLPLATSGGEAQLRFARRSHVGRVRTRNEDSVFAFTSLSGGAVEQLPFGLFLVADGMGGHKDGHEASRRATQIVARSVLADLFLPLLDGKGVPSRPVNEILVEAIDEANGAIYDPSPDRDGGTTMTAAVIIGRRLYLAHVGDSRAYLWEEGTLSSLTNDHTYVWRLLEAGQLTPDEAAIHPHRSVLYRAVGQGAELEVETYTCKLPQRGQLLLCSDGLTDLVDDAGVTAVLAGEDHLAALADRLIAEALASGGGDNVTVLLVDFDF